jgi:DNA-binding transcriptional regulator YdaS (Cro superfamily)
MNHVDRAIQAFGSQAAMAAALGITQPTVSEWLRGARRVPAERCLEVERATRRIAAEKGDPSLAVTCEELRPDVAWAVLRQKVASAEGAPPAPAEEARDAA